MWIRALRFVVSPLGLVVVVAALVVAFLVCEQVRGSARTRALGLALEAQQRATLAAEHVAVAAEASQRRLREEADALQGQLAEAERQLGERPKIREVTRWRTEEGVVYQGQTTGPTEPGEPGPPPCPPVAVRIAGTQATAETRAGAVFVVGKVSIERTQPLPVELFEVPFTAETTAASVAAPARAVPAVVRGAGGVGRG